jgi:hypothetical protein
LTFTFDRHHHFYQHTFFKKSNAGVYTKEEILRIFKCKLSKLQLLYKRQLKVLNEKLILDRKKYLSETRQGGETAQSVQSNGHAPPAPQQALAQYRSLNRKVLFQHKS